MSLVPARSLEAPATLRAAIAAVAVAALYSGAAQYWHAVRGGPRPLFLIVAIVGAALAILVAEAHRPTRVLRSPLLLWVAVYLFLSSAWALWRPTLGSQTDQALVDRYRSMAFLLAMAVAFDERRARFVGRFAVILVALAASVGNVAEELGLIGFADGLGRTAGRAGGLHGNANQAGLVIVFGLAVGLPAVPRILRIPLLVVAAAGVAATFSRAAMLCFCLLVLVSVWRRELDLAPAAAATVAVALLLTLTSGRIEGLLDSGGALNADTLGRLSMKADDSGRSRLAAEVWRMFVDSPWVGRGLATEREGRISHNIYLSLAAEHGVLGLLMFPALLVALAFRNREASPFVLVFLVAGFFGHGFLEQEPSLLCAALAAATPVADEEGDGVDLLPERSPDGLPGR